MKILLTGASGMIGSRILAEAVARGHSVTAVARNAGRIAAGPGVTVVEADANDAAELIPLAQEADAYVSALSSRSGGDPKAETLAWGQAAIAAARASGVRFVLVGGAGTTLLPDGTPVLSVVPEMYRAEAAAMVDMRDLLQESGIDWTFFAPAGTIAPGVRTGNFRVQADYLVQNAKGESTISAEDYAVAMVNELEAPAFKGKVMTIGYTA
ncbi:MAG: NAD(P)H-binding protein [Rhodobacteraceae bacterium]|nr:NAD(P)H-binding protein [Paracoccaceae bacterium]